MREFFDIVGIIVGATTVLAITIMGIISVIFFTIAPPSCYAQWKDSGMEVRWSMMGGCQLKTEGRWITDDAFVGMTRELRAK